MRQTYCIISRPIALLVGIIGSANALCAETSVYGKIHLSVDGVSTGYGKHTALSSNSSRIGFKGSEPLADWVVAIWRLESDIDVSGERGYLRARNRYAGLASKAGSLTGGVHDTPWKLVEQKFDIYGDTLFDARSLLGSSGAVFIDTGAKNSVLYKSPLLSGVQLNLLYSFGEEKRIDGSDVTSLTSASWTLKTEMLNLAIAYENQDRYHTEQWRAAGSFKFAMFRANAIYERLSSTLYSSLTREAVGGNFTVALPAGFSVHAQSVGVFNAAATMFVAAMAGSGISYNFAKSGQVYVLGGLLKNAATSGFTFANGGHGEQYSLFAAGHSAYAVSTGMIVKF
ncbi:MAG: porin [Pseudomonadota bacterium]